MVIACVPTIAPVISGIWGPKAIYLPVDRYTSAYADAILPDAPGDNGVLSGAIDTLIFFTTPSTPGDIVRCVADVNNADDPGIDT
jgi:hypothetical protein